MSKREFVKTYYQKFLDLNNSTQNSDQGKFEYYKFMQFICASRRSKKPIFSFLVHLTMDSLPWNPNPNFRSTMKERKSSRKKKAQSEPNLNR